MNRNYTVYLSSTTYHWWNLRSYSWKKDLRKLLSNKIFTIDPLEFKSEKPSVCPKDLKDINESSYVVIYLNKITIGTMLELGYCMFNNNIKKWCILTYNKKVFNHPWIQYLCKSCVYKPKIYTDIFRVADLINQDYYNKYEQNRY